MFELLLEGFANFVSMIDLDAKEEHKQIREALDNEEEDDANMLACNFNHCPSRLIHCDPLSSQQAFSRILVALGFHSIACSAQWSSLRK